MTQLSDNYNGRSGGHAAIAAATLVWRGGRVYPEQRSNRNRRKPREISYMKTSTRNSLRRSQSLSLTFLDSFDTGENFSVRLPRYFSRNSSPVNKTAEISRYTLQRLGARRAYRLEPIKIRKWAIRENGAPGTSVQARRGRRERRKKVRLAGRSARRRMKYGNQSVP